MPYTGEEIQALGSNGSERAKRWLEATCRAEVKWNNPNGHIKKLQFQKAGAKSGSAAQADFFSMDLGGTLLGGDADGDMFIAEVKKYQQPGDQPKEYRYFLAKCYLIESTRPDMFEHYLWITWAPFLVSQWKDLLGPKFIEQAVLMDEESKRIALGNGEVSKDLLEEVANKLMLVVLSDKQEVFLSLHGDELLGVQQALLEIRKNV